MHESASKLNDCMAKNLLITFSRCISSDICGENTVEWLIKTRFILLRWRVEYLAHNFGFLLNCLRSRQHPYTSSAPPRRRWSVPALLYRLPWLRKLIRLEIHSTAITFAYLLRVKAAWLWSGPESVEPVPYFHSTARELFVSETEPWQSQKPLQYVGDGSSQFKRTINSRSSLQGTILWHCEILTERHEFELAKSIFLVGRGNFYSGLSSHPPQQTKLYGTPVKNN